MPSLRWLFLSAICLASLAGLASLALAQDLPQPSDHVKAGPHVQFEAMLSALPAASLRSALKAHLHPKFQDGVYESERSAVARVHEENPSLASKVLHAAMAAKAKIELVKRQTSNSTTTTTDTTTSVSTTTATDTGASTSAGSTSSASSSSSSEAAVIIPIVSTVTNSDGNTSVVSTSAVASATVSVDVLVTTTDSTGQVLTTSSRVPAAIITTTDSVGQEIVTTRPVPTFQPNPSSPVDVTTTDSAGVTFILQSVTSGEVVSTTNAAGQSFITTFTPQGDAVFSLVLTTSHAPDGSLHTLTSFVSADTSAVGTASAGASGTSTRAPVLQNGAATARGVGREAMLAGGAGVLGAVMMLL